MKTAFAAVLALSLLSGTAMAAPSDMRGDHQGQPRQDRGGQDNGNRGDRGDRGGQNNQGQQGDHQSNGQGNGQNNNGQHNGQANAQPPRGNAPQQNNNGGGNWQQGNQQSQNDHRGNDRGDRGDHHYGNNDRNGSRDYVYNGRRYQAVRGPVWHAPRGYDAYRGWNRGDRLPAVYRDRAYVIDYRAYGLMRPPYGYQWVRVSNNVMLVNVYNGLISQIVLSMFY